MPVFLNGLIYELREFSNDKTNIQQSKKEILEDSHLTEIVWHQSTHFHCLDRGIQWQIMGQRFAILYVMLDKKVLNVHELDKKHVRGGRKSSHGNKVVKIAQIFEKEISNKVANKCID